MATRFKDYYETLGVSRNASEKEINAAFRRLARKHHPDVNRDDPGAVERFKEINEAHEVLGDAEKRRKYDELGPQWEQYEQWERAGRPGGAPPFGARGTPFGGTQGGTQVEYRTVSPEELESLFGSAESPFSDFFHTMFGRGATSGQRARRRPAARRGEDVEGTVTISLEEAYTGVDRTVEIEGPAGRRRVQVHIPAGIGDGSRVRAAGQGGTGSGGGQAGDLFMRVHIAPHPRFVREHHDLRTRVPVPLGVALRGGTVQVATPDGRRFELRIPPETQNGARLRLPGLGMPQVRGGAPGDLYAEVDLRLPLPLTREQREAAAAFS